MKKRAFSFILILAMMFSLCLAVQAEGTASVIKNIIYMIPDGGGYTLYDFADMVKQAGGLDSTKFPNKTPTDANPMTLKSYLAGTVTTASASSSLSIDAVFSSRFTVTLPKADNPSVTLAAHFSHIIPSIFTVSMYLETCSLGSS